MRSRVSKFFPADNVSVLAEGSLAGESKRESVRCFVSSSSLRRQGSIRIVVMDFCLRRSDGTIPFLVFLPRDLRVPRGDSGSDPHALCVE